MPLDSFSETPRPYEPDPDMLWVNGCIQIAPENCVPNPEDGYIPLILEQVNLAEEDLIWRDGIFMNANPLIAQRLIHATSIQFKGRFYRALTK